MWLAKEDFHKAILYYELALAISREMQSEGDIATTTGNLGIAYYQIAEKTGLSSPKRNEPLQKSIGLLEECVRACERLLLVQPNIEFLLSLSEAYSLNGNYREAYNSLKKHTRLHDSLNSSSVKQQIASIEMTREMELKNKNLKLKEQELQIRELELIQKRFLAGIYVAVIFIFMTIIVVLYRRYRKQKSTSKELMRLNEDYLRKINDQLTDLKKHSKVLSEISYMQAHQVRGPLSTLLGMIQLFRKDDLAHPDNILIMEHLEEITTKMDEAVKEVVRKENELLN
ncbi:MAG: hypothetical protein K1X81_14270 [Bacteroidia bacterium]|nr:hypothetical protein [Bacteroidia bacterium]